MPCAAAQLAAVGVGELGLLPEPEADAEADAEAEPESERQLADAESEEGRVFDSRVLSARGEADALAEQIDAAEVRGGCAILLLPFIGVLHNMGRAAAEREHGLGRSLINRSRKTA